MIEILGFITIDESFLAQIIITLVIYIPFMLLTKPIMRSKQDGNR